MTAGGTACTPHPTATSYIELTPNSLLTLTVTAGTNAQTLCNDTPMQILFIRYSLLASVDDAAAGTIDVQATGVEFTISYVATQQVEQITITSPECLFTQHLPIQIRYYW